MSNVSYITTTIPYVNAAPHVGFALELVQADAYARYHRLRGDVVRLQTGTDENALKNVLSARARGVPVRTLVDENAARFARLVQDLDVSADCFLRTTAEPHRRAVDVFLSRINPEDVYRRKYQGLYCTGCEDFWREEELRDGRCPDHDLSPTPVEEENIFFRLSKYETALRDIILRGALQIFPNHRAREVLRFIDCGLEDISISRDARRSENWGIPFPGDSSQVVYVWIDALINYLSGLGYPDGPDVGRYWDEAVRYHIIGKNVWKFHAVYWPALLLSAGLPLPNQIVVHGFLTEHGRKISKSRGAADPAIYVERFGSDALRYYLLRHISPFDDSDFTESRLASVYESELANGLGNLVSRLTTLFESAGLAGRDIVDPPAPAGFHEHVATFRFDAALNALWQEVADLNRTLAAAKPWVAIKAADLSTAQAVLSPCVERLAAIAHWLSPFLPRVSEKIQRQLVQRPIRKSAPLFPRNP